MNLTASIPVKPYVRKHLENCFGTPALIRMDSDIGKYFYQLVQDPTSRFDKRSTEYNDEIIIHISEDVFLRKGCVLTKTGIIAFNNFVEDHLKQNLRIMIDTLVEFNGAQIKDAIIIIYDKFNLDESVLPLETIKKDYYRHRKRRKALSVK